MQSMISTTAQLHHSPIQHLSFPKPHILPSNNFSLHSCKKKKKTGRRHRLEVRNSTGGDNNGDKDQPDVLETILRLYSASKDQNGTAAGDKDRPDVLQTISRLYSASKSQKNATKWPDLIGKPWQFYAILLPVIIASWDVKKQAMELFKTSLHEFMRKHVEFVIRPTKDDGMEVGLKWHIDCKGIHVPLGRASLYMSHVYQGKMFIRNIKFLLDPLMLNMKPFIEKMMEIAMPMLDKTANSDTPSCETARVPLIMYSLVTLLSMVIFLILWKNTFE